MTPFVQALLAYAAVALAAAWLLRRWIRARRTPTCDRCGPAGTPPRPRGHGVRPSSLRVLR